VTLLSRATLLSTTAIRYINDRQLANKPCLEERNVTTVILSQ
jgi:hypothetical protein